MFTFKCPLYRFYDWSLVHFRPIWWPGPVVSRPKSFKRYKNQWFFDARPQKTFKNIGFSNLSRGPTRKTIEKSWVFALSPDQSCSNNIKTSVFLMRGYKNNVKLLVSAMSRGPARKTWKKLMVFAWPPDQSCSNVIKTNGLSMQVSQNYVKLLVSATWVGSQREKH